MHRRFLVLLFILLAIQTTCLVQLLVGVQADPADPPAAAQQPESLGNPLGDGETYVITPEQRQHDEADSSNQERRMRGGGDNTKFSAASSNPSILSTTTTTTSTNTSTPFVCATVADWFAY